MQTQSPLLLNLVLCGDSRVGKSALIQSLLHSSFQPHYSPTVATEVRSTQMQTSSGHTVRLQLWDVSGDERYLSLGAVFFRSADCGLLLCDLTSPKSLDSLEAWRSEFLALASPARDDFPFVVIGMKKDREKDRRIAFTKAYMWARNTGNCLYYEVAAMDFQDVRRVFREVIDRVIHGEGYKQPGSLIPRPQMAHKRRCCC